MTSSTVHVSKAMRSMSEVVLPVTIEQEIQIGRAIASRLLGIYPLLHDEELTEYVEEESRAKSRVTDYQSLDLVGRYRILNEQLREFVTEGGLSPEVFP